MGRQFKVLLIGAAFTVVAMGFAYAVPRAMHSAANDPPRNSIVLLTGGNESPSPSGSPEGSGDDACAEPTASDEPCDDDDGADESQDNEGGDDSATNHGSAVRVAAHCPVRGRAHGELVRSIAHDKEATVASAEQACADAMAEDAQDGSKTKPGKKAKPAKKTKKAPSSGHDHDVGPSGSNAPKPPKVRAPKAPRAPAPKAPKASSTAGSGSAAPGNPAGHGKAKGKSK